MSGHGPKTEDQYATIIQSQWRGHQVRRSMKAEPGSLAANAASAAVSAADAHTAAAAAPAKPQRSVAASRAASNAEALLAAQSSQKLLQEALSGPGPALASRAPSMQPSQQQITAGKPLSSHPSANSLRSSTSARSLQAGVAAQPSHASQRSTSSSQSHTQGSAGSLTPAAAAPGTPWEQQQQQQPQQQPSQASVQHEGSRQGSLSSQSSGYHSAASVPVGAPQGGTQQPSARSSITAQGSFQHPAAQPSVSRAPSAASIPASSSRHHVAAAAAASRQPSAAAAAGGAGSNSSRDDDGAFGSPSSASIAYDGVEPHAVAAGQQMPEDASPAADGSAHGPPSRAASAHSHKSLQQHQQQPTHHPSSSSIGPAAVPPGPAVPAGLLSGGSAPGAKAAAAVGSRSSSPAPRLAMGYLGRREGGPPLRAEASVADEVDPDKRLMVKNVGALRAAVARHQPPPEMQLLQQWKQFATRQQERFVPAPPNAHRLVKPQSDSYRIRIHSVKGLPTNLPGKPQTPTAAGPLSAAAGGALTATTAMPGVLGSSFEFELGLSLYDEALGAFYGATCYSHSQHARAVAGGPAAAQQGLAGPAAAAGGLQGPHMTVDFGFDAYFHSCIADPQCMAVLEVILVDRNQSDPNQGRYSLGWAMLPVFPTPLKQQEGHGAAGRAGAGGGSGCGPKGRPSPPVLQPGQVMVMPVLAGTPRYLMFRSVTAGELPPPRILEGCHVVFQVDQYPALDRATPLLPPDFMTTHREVIPGLRRFQMTQQGQQQVAAWSSSTKDTTSSLAEPVLAPLTAVKLSSLTITVPQLVHNLLAALPHIMGSKTPPQDLVTALSVPTTPTAVRYILQYGVHNGRCFVGPLLTTPELVSAPQLGVVALQVPQLVPLLPWVVQDVCVAIVVQLVATPAQQMGRSSSPVVVGRAAFAPHVSVAPDGNSAVLASGPHRYTLASCRRDPNCCSTLFPQGGSPPLLDWRTVLQDTAARQLADPTINFTLEAAAVEPGMPGTPAALAALAPAPGQQKQQQPTVQRAPSAPVPPQAAAQQQQDYLGAEPSAEDLAHHMLSMGLGGSLPAAEAARALAEELERAATLPLEERPGPAALPPAARDMLSEALAQQQYQQYQAQHPGVPRELVVVTETMQMQLQQLARAVAELKEERASLRQSLTLQTTVLQAAAAAVSANSPRPGSPVLLDVRRHSPEVGAGYSPPRSQLQPGAAQGSGLSAEDQQLFDSLPGVNMAGGGGGGGGGGRFQGSVADGQCVAGAGAGVLELPLARALLQQLHEAGMQHALPAEVRSALQRTPQVPRAPTLTPATIPMALELESRDPRTRSEVILQLLSFKPAGESLSAAGARPSCLYFTLQFYQFEAVVTESALLSAPGDGGYHVILPLGQQNLQGRAGLVLKHVVDGSCGPVAPGLTPGQAAHREHLSFSSYLASRQLVIDVWDGESLLQLGSAPISLQGLLRQGQELSELLLDVPIVSSSTAQHVQHSTAAGTPAATTTTSSNKAVGQLVVRLINLGRPSAVDATRTEEFDCAGQVKGSPSTPNKKVRCRAVPYEPSSPVAQELCGLSTSTSNCPFAVDWAASGSPSASPTSTLSRAISRPQTAGPAPSEQLQQQQLYGTAGGGTQQGLGTSSSSRGLTGTTGSRWPGVSGGGAGSPRTPSAGDVTADILNFEHRKLVRDRHLRQLSTPSSPSRGGSGLASLQRPGSPWSAVSPGGGSPVHPATAAAAGAGMGTGQAGEQQQDTFRDLQRQMLADVAAVRLRQKASFMRSQLRKGLVTQLPVSCCPGETRLLLYTLANPLAREAVFTLNISHPQLLQPVEQRQELQQLKAALDPSCVVQLGGSGSSKNGDEAGKAEAAGGGVTPLAQMAARQMQQGGAAGSSKQGPPEQLCSSGRIFLAANEAVVVPFKYVLPRTTKTPLQPFQQQQADPAAGQSANGAWWMEPHTVLVEFVAEGHTHPAAAMELQATPKPLIVDRTLRYYCSENDLLTVQLPLSSSSSSSSSSSKSTSTAAAAAAAAGSMSTLGTSDLSSKPWMAASDNQQVMLSIVQASPSQQHQEQLQTWPAPSSSSSEAAQLALRYRCGHAPEVSHFHVWVYGDVLQARPLEVWQVFVHSLKRVDISAQVGSTTTAALAIRGAATDRQVACYSSRPALLQPQPPSMLLPAGGVSELGLLFRPLRTGTEQVRVHLVDMASRELAQAFIVAVQGLPPPYSRSFEVEVPANGTIQKKVSYSNQYQLPRSLQLSTNLPGVLSFQPQVVELAPGSTQPIGMVFNGPAAAAAAGAPAGSQAQGQQLELFVFLKDLDERGEECWRVVVKLQ